MMNANIDETIKQFFNAKSIDEKNELFFGHRSSQAFLEKVLEKEKNEGILQNAVAAIITQNMKISAETFSKAVQANSNDVLAVNFLLIAFAKMFSSAEKKELAKNLQLSKDQTKLFLA